MKPNVSVIIPVYNTEKLLPRCLQSVTEQSLTNIEIICVNDGSTDNSLDVLQKWVDKDNRIVVINQANGRQGKARNAAMAIANGEYIGMIDSDDYIPANYFEKLYNATVTNNAEIAICGIIKEKPAGNRTVIEFKESTIATTTQEKLQVCKCPPEFHPVNKLYSREMLERIGLRFAEGVQYEDVMFVFRAICESNRLVTVPDICYRYVLNSSSTVKSKQTEAKQLQKYSAHKAMTDYAEQNGISIPNRYKNLTVTHKSISGICLWKIKEKNNKRTLRLFDALPVWSWKKTEENAFNAPIDLVYMWVDGNDPQWRARRNSYLNKTESETSANNSEARWIENDELKYSLRSVELFAPWINRIYIVTDNQSPKWLNRDNPKIHIIDHKEILPADALPTFSATAIESCISNIPGLSEYFILGNDDLMFTAPVTQTDFFTENGLPIVHLRKAAFNKRKAHKKGNYHIILDRMQNLVAEKYGKNIFHAPHHCFDSYRKSIYNHCIEDMQAEWNHTVHNRFRNNSDMHRSYIGYYMIATGKGKLHKVGRYDLFKSFGSRIKAFFCGQYGSYSRCIPITTPNFDKVLNRYNPLMICLNDGENATDNDRKRMVEFLQSLFPEKSSFEK